VRVTSLILQVLENILENLNFLTHRCGGAQSCLGPITNLRSVWISLHYTIWYNIIVLYTAPFCWKYFYLQMCKLDFRSQSGKGPSPIIAVSSVQTAVLKPFTWEIILSILLLYTPRAYSHTHTNTRTPVGRHPHLRNALFIYIFLLLFHYDILTRTSEQLFEDRFGIAFLG